MPLAVDLAVRRYGFVVEVRLDAVDGETLALLGPNGAGKSTVVEALAGLLPVERGSIAIDGTAVEYLPPERRPIGVTFQDTLLFPHLSALENVAFPLRARGGARQAARANARAVLTELAPEVPHGARPGALSGGERQRVALARALASEPRLLILDEPLAAVDVSARAELRSVLRSTVDGFDGVCVLVAHDPLDALTLADRVVILELGRVVQSGTPQEIRDAPASGYAADLVGVNLFQGSLDPQPDGTGRLATTEGDITVAWPDVPPGPVAGVIATLRPTDVALHLGRPEGSPRNVMEGEVLEIAHIGERARVRLRTRPPLVAEVTRGSIDRLRLAPGTHVFASFKAVEVRLALPGAPNAASAANTSKAGTLDA